MKIHTVGHSTRSVDELIALLAAAGVTLLIDVRAYPRSRRNPQFNSDVLSDALAAAGLGYRHVQALGGRRGRQELGFDSPNGHWRVEGFRNYADYALTEGFHAGLDTLLDLAGRQNCAVMCAEAAWQQCHRQIIADYLLGAGVEVVHILGPGRHEAARINPAAMVQSDGTIHYRAAQGTLL